VLRIVQAWRRGTGAGIALCKRRLAGEVPAVKELGQESRPSVLEAIGRYRIDGEEHDENIFTDLAHKLADRGVDGLVHGQQGVPGGLLQDTERMRLAQVPEQVAGRVRLGVLGDEQVPVLALEQVPACGGAPLDGEHLVPGIRLHDPRLVQAGNRVGDTLPLGQVVGDGKRLSLFRVAPEPGQ
jgi:hypothetical protein